MNAISETQDYHVMVVDSDEGERQSTECRECCEVQSLPPAECRDEKNNCDGTLPGCPSGACETWNPCSSTPWWSCDYETDPKFCAEGGIGVGLTFQCLANVGSNGSGSEKMLQSMLFALNPNPSALAHKSMPNHMISPICQLNVDSFTQAAMKIKESCEKLRQKHLPEQ